MIDINSFCLGGAFGIIVYMVVLALINKFVEQKGDEQ